MPEPTIQVSVRLPERTYKAAQKRAAKDDMSLARYIVVAVENANAEVK